MIFHTSFLKDGHDVGPENNREAWGIPTNHSSPVFNVPSYPKTCRRLLHGCSKCCNGVCWLQVSLKNSSTRLEYLVRGLCYSTHIIASHCELSSLWIKKCRLNKECVSSVILQQTQSIWGQWSGTEKKWSQTTNDSKSSSLASRRWEFLSSSCNFFSDFHRGKTKPLVPRIYMWLTLILSGGSGSIALRRTPDKGSDGLACSTCGHWPDKGFAENWRTSWASYTQSRRSFTRIILWWLKAEAITSTFVGTSSVMSRLSVAGKLDSCDTRAKSKTSLILPKIWINHANSAVWGTTRRRQNGKNSDRVTRQSRWSCNDKRWEDGRGEGRRGKNWRFS